MAFIDTIAPSGSQGVVREMYERQEGTWGYVPNYAKVFSHRPEVMVRWARLLSEIRRPMDARRFELITFAAAHALRNSACALAHGNNLTEFFSADEVRGLTRGDDANCVTEAESSMMNFARKVALDASLITSMDVVELKGQGFSDAEIFDISSTAAARAFFTKILDSLGVDADSPFQQMDPLLRESLTVGRPISTSELEHVNEEPKRGD